MLTRFARSIGVLSLGLAPIVAGAQRRESPTVARLTPYVGYMAFGSWADGPLGTHLTNQGAPIYGAQLGIDFTPNIAVVGNFGFSDSNVEVGVPILGGLKVADSRAFLYDGGLQLRLPALSSLGTGVIPYVEGGIGVIHFDVTGGPITTSSNNTALNFGGGADLQVTRQFGLRLMVKDYVGKFNFQQATGLSLTGNTAHNLMFGAGLNLAF